MKIKIVAFAVLSLGWMGLSATVSPAAEGIPRADATAAAEKIQINADQLVTDNQNRYAEFSGDVVAKQGDFEIKSDRLRIYYKGDLREQQQSGSTDAIEKIVAEGNVSIRAEQNYARTQKAEYSVADMQIVLIGDESTVVTGKNSITGARIVYNRKEGWIRVEKGKNKRVRAIIYPDEKTIPGGGQKKK